MKIVKRWITILFGGLVTILGLILMPVPGPGGFPVTVLGLSILSMELPWAKVVMEKLKQRVEFLKAGKRNKWINVGLIGGLTFFYLTTSFVVAKVFFQ